MADERGGQGEVARYFCTAGRGMEPFLLREVQARLGATQVEYVSGKVFFTTSAGLKKLRKLKSAERLFLLLDKYPPLVVSRNKGKVIHDLQKLVNDNSRSWLDTLTLWRNVHGEEVKQENYNQEYSIKRILEDEQSVKSKKQKTEGIPETPSAESELENPKRDDTPKVYKDSVLSLGRSLVEETSEVTQDKSPENENCSTFRVSCRCSGALAKAFTAQELGRMIGVALMKNFGWKADLRNPDIEIFVHLNNIYSVIGIPVFRLPLAHRVYIKTAGLRSTIAWAMASLAELKAGSFALDPTCGLGTILLEAATEWPNVHYLGTDISDSQLHGAASNIKAAGLMDKIDLMKASVTALPLPSESIDVVFADFPFGKKFKITKDMMLLPAVFQEIERVLCAEGTAVLLLSHELFHYISDDPAKGSGTDICISAESTSDCEPNALALAESDAKEESSSPRSVSSSIQEARKKDLSHERTTLGSLVLVEFFEVSLGRTDAFMCKYKKR